MAKTGPEGAKAYRRKKRLDSVTPECDENISERDAPSVTVPNVSLFYFMGFVSIE